MSIFFHTDDTPLLRLEIAWDTHLSRRSMLKQMFSPLSDIDSGIIFVSKEGKAIDESYYGQLASKDGSVQNRSDDTVNTPLVPDPSYMVEQYDVDLSHVNYAVESFSLFLFSQSSLDTEERKVESVSVSLTVPEEEIVVSQESTVVDTEDAGFHVAVFTRLSKKEWKLDFLWKSGAFTDIRSTHEGAEIAEMNDLKEQITQAETPSV